MTDNNEAYRFCFSALVILFAIINEIESIKDIVNTEIQ